MQSSARPLAQRSSSISRVGRYHLIRTIGKGNFSVVKLGKHDVTKSKVAVKIVDKTTVGDENLKKIYREIQILKTLNHPHIIKLYQVMETDSKLFIITEYASGGEVFEHLRKNSRMNEREARRVFRQTVSAVVFCHCSGVVHRDLKAENLLFSRELDIKLVDFGFSNYASENSFLQTWCGSPPYAAPELFLGEKYYGQKADVWSLGVILYILVSGGFPFPSASIEQLRNAILEGHVSIPFYVSAECSDLIRRMLVVNPKQRFNVRQIVQHKWFTSTDWSDAWSDLISKSLNPESMPFEILSINYACVAYMQQRGYSSDQIVESVSQKRFDEEYATYHLLCDKLKKRNKVLADLASSNRLAACNSSTHNNNTENACVDPGRRGSRGSITTGKVDAEIGSETPLISTIDMAKLGMSSSDEEIVSSESDTSSPSPAAANLQAYLNHRRHTALGFAAGPPPLANDLLSPGGSSFCANAAHMAPAVPYPLQCALGDAFLSPQWLGGFGFFRPTVAPFLAQNFLPGALRNAITGCVADVVNSDVNATAAASAATLNAYNAALLAAAAAQNLNAFLNASGATSTSKTSSSRRRSAVGDGVEETTATRYQRCVRGSAKRHTIGPSTSLAAATATASSSLRNEPYPGGAAVSSAARRATTTPTSSLAADAPQEHLTPETLRHLEALYQNAVNRSESPVENMRNLQQEFQHLKANNEIAQVAATQPFAQPHGSWNCADVWRSSPRSTPPNQALDMIIEHENDDSTSQQPHQSNNLPVNLSPNYDANKADQLAQPAIHVFGESGAA